MLNAPGANVRRSESSPRVGRRPVRIQSANVGKYCRNGCASGGTGGIVIGARTSAMDFKILIKKGLSRPPTLSAATMSQSYDTLLKRAKEALPKPVSSGERFQVPEADLIVEGKTTVLRNFLDVTTAINRDPDQVLQYLLRELGTAGALEDRRVVFKGKVTAAQVADRIRSYIDTYVICSECGRPDTRLVKEDRVAILECDACGARRPVKVVKKAAKVEEAVLAEGKVYEVMIQDIGKKGDGIAKKDKYIIYVPGTTKGAIVKVFIEKIAGTVAFGHIHRE